MVVGEGGAKTPLDRTLETKSDCLYCDGFSNLPATQADESHNGEKNPRPLCIVSARVLVGSCNLRVLPHLHERDGSHPPGYLNEVDMVEEDREELLAKSS